jgi:tetratricopeptide (TPR) repeat protein
MSPPSHRKWVGHLPLALVLLNRVLRARAVTREELLARSRQVGPVQELDRQQAAIQRHIPKGSLPGVTEVLRISYDRLLPAEQRAARFFAQLGHEPIPQALLDALDAELASMDIRATLTARSFVTPVAAEVGSAVTMFGAMHRVLADFLRSQSPEPAREWEEAAAALLRVMTPEACQDPGAWQLMGACLPHAEALLDRPQATAGEPQVKLAVQLGLHTGVLLMSRGFYAQAYQFFTISLERGEPVLGKLHELTLSARSNIAFVLHKQGETHAAIEVTQALLDELASTSPSEATKGLVLVEITALNSLAVFKRASGELKEAREIQEELVTLSERLFGPMDPKTLTSMDNLAVTLTEQGGFEEARKLQERVLAAFAPQSHDALIAKANMAMALLKQRQAGRAAELLEQVVEEQQRILGENHPTTLSAMSNLGSVYAEQEEYAKAQKLYEPVLGRCRQVLGEHHPRTLHALTSLFAVTMALEDFVRAEPLGQERLELLTRLQGVDAPDTQEAMDMLAKVRLMREDLPGARKLYEDLLVIHRRVHGDHAPKTRKTHALLFGLAFKLQDFTRAAELLQENLVLQLREKGEDHPDTQEVLLKLAFTRHKQGNYEEARALQQRRVQSHVKTFGENDPRTLAVLADVATMLHSQGDNQGANEILEPLIEKSRRQLGDEHPETLYVMELLAKTLEQGAPQRAAELLAKVTEARSRLPDPGTKGTPSS